MPENNDRIIPIADIQGGILIKDLQDSETILPSDELPVSHTGIESNDTNKTYRASLQKIAQNLKFYINEDGVLKSTFTGSQTPFNITINNLDNNLILPVKKGGTGSSTEKYLKNTTDTLNGVLTVFDEYSGLSSVLGKDLSTHTITCDSLTSENDSYINADLYVKNSTSTHATDIKVSYGEDQENMLAFSANKNNQRGLWDFSTGNWLVYSNGLGSTTNHIFNGTASCARALSSPNGEVYIYNYNNNQTRYRVVFTGYGNLRVDKSTDSGQTWEIDHYAAHVPNVSTTALRKAYFGDNMNGKNNNPTASYFLCINKDWKNGGFITIDEAKSFLKVPTVVQDATANGSGGVTLNNNTAQIVQTITLTPGRYIISYGCNFTSNTSGIRICQLRTQSTNTFSWSRRAAVSTAGAGNGTPLQRTAHVNVTQNTTYRLWAKQTSGTTLSCYSYIDYTKITV